LRFLIYFGLEFVVEERVCLENGAQRKTRLRLLEKERQSQIPPKNDQVHEIPMPLAGSNLCISEVRYRARCLLEVLCACLHAVQDTFLSRS
jgi:hypothetical protein